MGGACEGLRECSKEHCFAGLFCDALILCFCSLALDGPLWANLWNVADGSERGSNLRCCNTPALVFSLTLARNCKLNGKMTIKRKRMKNQVMLLLSQATKWKKEILRMFL